MPRSATKGATARSARTARAADVQRQPSTLKTVSIELIQAAARRIADKASLTKKACTRLRRAARDVAKVTLCGKMLETLRDAPGTIKFVIGKDAGGLATVHCDYEGYDGRSWSGALDGIVRQSTADELYRQLGRCQEADADGAHRIDAEHLANCCIDEALFNFLGAGLFNDIVVATRA